MVAILQAVHRMLLAAKASLGDVPHADMLLRRLLSVLLQQTDSAMFHKLVGGARNALGFKLCPNSPVWSSLYCCSRALQ